MSKNNSSANPAIDCFHADRATDHLMKLLALPGASGEEAQVAAYIRSAFEAAGVKPSAITHDGAHRALNKESRGQRSFEIGNMVTRIPGRGSLRRTPRLLFMGHMDTVPLCRGAVPKLDVRAGRIDSAGNTALGGDNRTSIGALISLVEALQESGVDHPPITILCTIAEEIGLLGAKHATARKLGNPTMGFNVDSGQPAGITIGAIGADRFTVDVYGRSSHAGVHPEDGISAIVIASRAIADITERGYFGKIDFGGSKVGTSNFGRIEGGEATNQVTDHVHLTGESRSHSKSFLRKITREIEQAFLRAAKSVKNSSGESGRIVFAAHHDYDAFRMPKGSPPVKAAMAAAKRLGLESNTRIANGGLDANMINALDVPTVTLGAGQHNPHTVDEYVDLQEYVDGCRLLIEIATGG